MSKLLRNILIVAASVLITAGVVRWVAAGSLTPNASTAPTMSTAQVIYNAAVGVFNATSTATTTGSAIQIAKCIAQRITGGTCP